MIALCISSAPPAVCRGSRAEYTTPERVTWMLAMPRRITTSLQCRDAAPLADPPCSAPSCTSPRTPYRITSSPYHPITLTPPLLEHLQQLVRLAQLGYQDRLTLGDTPIVGVELAVLAERVDLMQGEMVWVEVSRGIGPAVFEDFVEALLDCREFVCLRGVSGSSRVIRGRVGGRRDGERQDEREGKGARGRVRGRLRGRVRGRFEGMGVSSDPESHAPPASAPRIWAPTRT
jgi:hypothetical protein